jgi:hypothetical protein
MDQEQPFLPERERQMTYRILAFCFMVIFVSAFAGDVAVAKRRNDDPNAGTCKSGNHVSDLKDCKENGGKK